MSLAIFIDKEVLSNFSICLDKPTAPCVMETRLVLHNLPTVLLQCYQSERGKIIYFGVSSFCSCCRSFTDVIVAVSEIHKWWDNRCVVFQTSMNAVWPMNVTSCMALVLTYTPRRENLDTGVNARTATWAMASYVQVRKFCCAIYYVFHYICVTY